MAERIIGYQFKDVDRLYEALDQKKQPISLSSGRKRTRNTPLALVGDAHAKLYVAQKWYDNPDLTGFNWQEITSTLSNDHLGEVGFKLGLDECASKFCFMTNANFSRDILRRHSPSIGLFVVEIVL